LEEKKVIMVFISPKIRVQQSPIHRWGVFAVEKIKAEEILEESPMVEIEQRWLDQDESVFASYRYNFPSGGEPQSQQVCLGYGSIYNHSNEPNAYWYSMYYSPNIATYRFVALRDIEPSEEICTCYGNGEYDKGR